MFPFLSAEKIVGRKVYPNYVIKRQPINISNIVQKRFQQIQKCKHQNLVELIDVKKSKHNLYIFQQLCDAQTLQDQFRNKTDFLQFQALRIMRQLVAGYKELYDKNVIHGDIKPSNILIRNSVYKLSDYGLLNFYQTALNLSKLYHCIIDNPLYKSPQIIKGQIYTQKSDIWSLGTIFYNLLYKKTPFHATNMNELVQKINSHQIIYPKKLNNQKIQQLLRNMLRKLQDQRISWKQIFQDQLFAKQKTISFGDCQIIVKKQCQEDKEANFSMLLNKKYFQDKKIIQQSDILIDRQNFDQVVQKEKYDIEQIKLKLAKMRTSRQIKNWFIYKRNKAVFLNHLALKLHEFFVINIKNGKNMIQDSKSLPRQIKVLMLALFKMQCRITFISYSQLKQGDLKCNNLTQEQFKLFCTLDAKNSIKTIFKDQFKTMNGALEYWISQFLKDIQTQQSQSMEKIKKICHGKIDAQPILLEILMQSIKKTQIMLIQNLKKLNLQEDKQTQKCINEILFLTIKVKEIVQNDLSTFKISQIYDN